MRLHIGEGSRRTDAFGAEIGDHDPLAERVGEIDFRAVAVHRGTVGDREPCGTSGCDAAAVEKIKTPARRAFRVVHRTEPAATPGVGAAVVEPGAGWLRGVGRERHVEGKSESSQRSMGGRGRDKKKNK